jgi:hypothetical protein
VVADLLAPGGWLYFAEAHPAMLNLDQVDDRLVVGRGWRSPPDAPHIYEADTTYTGDTAKLAHPRTYEWAHPFSEIIGGLLAAGLRLDFLHEHEILPWQAFPMMLPAGQGMFRLPETHPALALSFSLRATKPARTEI